MSYPVCVTCERRMRSTFTGAYLITMAFDPPEPYEIYSCDIWGCPQCGAEVVNNRGPRPLHQHWESDFKSQHQSILAKHAVGIGRVVYEYEKGRPEWQTTN